jgi:hypothetical protein
MMISYNKQKVQEKLLKNTGKYIDYTKLDLNSFIS